MLFHQVRVYTFLLSFLLMFLDFFCVSRDVFAQSILSDRVWLEQQIKAFVEKELTDQKNKQVSMSSMMHAPLIFNQSVASPFVPEKPK